MGLPGSGSREITLADYIKKVTQYSCVVVDNEPLVSTDIKVAQWPCVVVGGEPPKEKEKEDGIY
jgi:hypothetical protein